MKVALPRSQARREHDPRRRSRTRRGGLSVALSVLALVGCSPYQLTGRVVEGPVSAVQVLTDPSAGYEGAALPGAQVTVILEPDRPSPQAIGTGYAGPDGRFSIPVDVFGAGTLEHKVSIRVKRSDFKSAELTTVLPRRGRHVAVSLERGEDTGRGDESLIEETLREAAPFMR